MSVLESFFFKETLTPPVATPGKIRTISLKLAKFQSQVFLTVLDIVSSLHCDIIVVKRDIRRKIFVVVLIHISIQTSQHLN